MTILKDFSNSIKNKNIHIIGVSGTEGSEIALFLHQQNVSKVTLHDFSNQDEFINNIRQAQYGLNPQELESRIDQITFLPYEINYKNNYLNNIEKADLIFAPQSWPLYPQNQKLNPFKDKISSITELYLKLLPKNTIGITGSNGKSSTSFMLHQALTLLGLKSHLSGNDRRSHPLLCQIQDLKQDEWIVLEISNRQLDQIELSPHIAILLNISENHLDEYNNDISKYIQAKSKIFKLQTTKDYCLLNFDNDLTKNLADKVPSQLRPYKLQLENQNLIVNDFVFPTEKLQIQGNHNYSNLTAVIQTLQIIGFSNTQINNILPKIKSMPDRQEFISTIDQITYINDRQGTSVDATLQAVENLNHPLTLIFGGANKHMPVKKLANSINKNCVLSIGIQSPFVDDIAPFLNNLKIVNTTEEAFRLAHAKTPKPGTVVFSPACSYGPYFVANPDLNPSFNKFKEFMLNPPK